MAAPSTNDADGDDPDTDVESTTFPLGRQFPFTFKMMLHKLYELDDWGKKVREVLDKSQSEFKSLAESEEMFSRRRDGAGQPTSDGRVQLKGAVGGFGGKRSSVAMGRRRSCSVGGSILTKDFSATKEQRVQLSNQALTPNPQSDVRALKKRCVGRRKSVNKLGNGGVGVPGGWVYDAAISSLEAKDSIRRRRVSSVALNSWGGSWNLSRNPRSAIRHGALTIPDLNSKGDV
jgi:hypothetical protein